MARQTRFPSSLKKPDQILNDPRSSLRAIVAESQRLLSLESIIRNFVPPQVHVASIRDKTLHLVTESGAVATQIRYRQRSILAAIRKQASDLNIQTLKVSVRPINPEPEITLPEAKPPSPENARQLASTAQYIEDDSLRKALINLSKRANMPPGDQET